MPPLSTPLSTLTPVASCSTEDCAENHEENHVENYIRGTLSHRANFFDKIGDPTSLVFAFIVLSHELVFAHVAGMLFLTLFRGRKVISCCTPFSHLSLFCSSLIFSILFSNILFSILLSHFLFSNPLFSGSLMFSFYFLPFHLFFGLIPATA